VIALLSAAIIGRPLALLKFGTYGIWIRATTQDRVMAQAMGIPVPWSHNRLAIGAAMAAPAACFSAHSLVSTTPWARLDFEGLYCRCDRGMGT